MANTKTPAMILQEFTVKHGKAPPEYNLILSKTGTHDNEFHYQVVVAGICTVGFGRSKQVAKHDAAQKALETLAERGIYSADINLVQQFNPKLHRNESDSPLEPTTNYVGTLKDLCVENKILYPLFEEISDVGPAHARQFTWKCTVSSITTQSTANTKKQAKQLCAKEMLQRIKDVLPEMVMQQEEISKNAITDTNTIISKHAELTTFPGVVLNKAVNIADYNLAIKKIMEEKELKYEDFAEYFLEGSEDALKEMLALLDLTYKINKLQDKQPCIVTISISLDVPFSCFGMAGDYDRALTNALEHTFFVLGRYMRIVD